MWTSKARQAANFEKALGNYIRVSGVEDQTLYIFGPIPQLAFLYWMELDYAC